MPNAKVEAARQSLLKSLRKRHAQLRSEMRRVQDSVVPLDAGRDRRRVDQAAKSMMITAAGVANQLIPMADAARRSADAERLFRFEHGITRDPKRPDLLATTALISLGWTIETTLTAISLYGDGHTELITAAAFGATFSTANVGLGLWAGFIARYLNIGMRDGVLSAADRFRRPITLATLFGFGAAHILMVWTAGRVRVLGKHEGIFDFSEVGLGAMFNDGLALVIMLTGVLAFLVSAWKGYGGLTDPMPGYLDHVGKAGEEILQGAQDIVADAVEALDEIAEIAEDDLDALWATPDDVEALIEDIETFNADVDDAKDQLRVLALREWERHCLIAGADVARPRLDLSSFDTLKLDPAALTPPAPCRDLLDELRQAQIEASSAIMAAFARFSASIHRGVVLPPLSDSDPNPEA